MECVCSCKLTYRVTCVSGQKYNQWLTIDIPVGFKAFQSYGWRQSNSIWSFLLAYQCRWSCTIIHLMHRHYSSGWHTIKASSIIYCFIFLFYSKILNHLCYFCSKTKEDQRPHPAERCTKSTNTVNTVLCTLCFIFSIYRVELQWRLVKEWLFGLSSHFLFYKDNNECQNNCFTARHLKNIQKLTWISVCL